MNLEDYNEYYIQGSDHYLIPKDVFKELFNEMVNWKEESQKKKEVIDKAKTELDQGITFCQNDSQGLYDKCNIAINREQKILDILKEVE